MAGVPTAAGMPIHRDYRPQDTATVVKRLQAAGAVILGKLQLTEGAYVDHHPQVPPPVNPWNAERWSGASSSGSGVATAAGLCYGSLGSDTGGSIRFPCAAQGLTGVKPTWGRVSRYGVFELAATLDHIGPMTRSAADAAAMLGAIAGADPRDPTAATREYRYDASVERPFRFAVVRGTIDASEPTVRDGVRQALATLGELGSIEEITLPDRPYEAMARVILWAEGASAFERLIEDGVIASLTAPEDRVAPYARDAILAKDYLRALRLRGVVAREIDGVLSRFDAIVGPSRPAVAARLREEFRSPIRGGAADVLGAIGNAAGLPSVGVPCGVTPEGLPIGLQFMGRAWNENVVLAAARAWQAQTDFHRRRPPLA
jgi:Asp-tRNA(Asn)/Glu-tRNA(Gln) amidotransferase A subunit family amidase